MESKEQQGFNFFDEDIKDEEFVNILKQNRPNSDNLTAEELWTRNCGVDGVYDIMVDLAREPENVVNFDGTQIPSLRATFDKAKTKLTRSSTQTLQPVMNPFSRSHNRSKSSVETQFTGSQKFRAAEISSDLSIKSVLDSCRNNPTKDDIELLEDVIMKQKTAFKLASDRWTPLPVTATIKAISLSQPYSLELYTSLKSKLSLLDHALACSDGNAITAITLFMRDTLSPKIFVSELKRRPKIAANHYLAYLKSRYDFDAMLSFYRLSGLKEEEAMLEYKLSLTTDSGADGRIRNLQNCYRNHFHNVPSLKDNGAMIEEQIALLERQRPIEMADFDDEKSGRVAIFHSYPRKASIINMSVITTLYYCGFYHFDKTENHLACPESIRKQHQLTDRQYVWPMLAARAKLKCWTDIERMFTAKAWYGGTKLRSVIGFDKVADVLHKLNAPNEIISKYLREIDDLEHRLSLAKLYQVHKVVVDTLVSLKRKGELEIYKGCLPVHSGEHGYARDALSNSSIRWK